MTPQDPDRILAHALGVDWDGPAVLAHVQSHADAPGNAQPGGLPPAPWGERDRWWAYRLENWVREAQAWYQSAERWRFRCRLACWLLALTWAWVAWLAVREWVSK